MRSIGHQKIRSFLPEICFPSMTRSWCRLPHGPVSAIWCTSVSSIRRRQHYRYTVNMLLESTLIVIGVTGSNIDSAL
jgi:hypothetical protein